MKCYCCCCGCVMEITIDELLEVDAEDEFICEDCSNVLYDAMMEWKLRLI